MSGRWLLKGDLSPEDHTPSPKLDIYSVIPPQKVSNLQGSIIIFVYNLIADGRSDSYSDSGGTRV
jgi:hypothetical protein